MTAAVTAPLTGGKAEPLARSGQWRGKRSLRFDLSDLNSKRSHCQGQDQMAGNQKRFLQPILM